MCDTSNVLAQHCQVTQCTSELYNTVLIHTRYVATVVAALEVSKQ
jgi:hypothetical protein